MKKKFMKWLWSDLSCPKGYRDAEDFVREVGPEKLLLMKIFDGRARYRNPEWWAWRVLVWLLP